MILVCPLCQTRYLVQATHFAAGPRPVRCARCKHGWVADSPNHIEAVVAPPPPQITPVAPVEPAPVPEGSNLPVVHPSPLEQLWSHLRWVLLAMAVIGLLFWLVTDRQNLGRHWTFLAPVYEALNLSIYYPGEELEFDDVRSELRFESGITKLILEGKIKNKTKKSQKVPIILAEALGADGQAIQSWQIDPPQATLAPGEDVAFSSSMNAPKGSVVNVNLNFEIKDDD